MLTYQDIGKFLKVHLVGGQSIDGTYKDGYPVTEYGQAFHVFEAPNGTPVRVADSAIAAVVVMPPKAAVR